MSTSPNRRPVRAALAAGVLFGLAYLVAVPLLRPAQVGLATDVYFLAAERVLAGEPVLRRAAGRSPGLRVRLPARRRAGVRPARPHRERARRVRPPDRAESAVGRCYRHPAGAVRRALGCHACPPRPPDFRRWLRPRLGPLHLGLRHGPGEPPAGARRRRRGNSARPRRSVAGRRRLRRRGDG